MIREEVWKLVEESRATCQVLSALNATFLTLIPKEEQVTNPKQRHLQDYHQGHFSST
jgi:hypothetical protein